ncbi:sensor histidine kinase [Neobacillus niacini]|uniref:cache domain-containing sensor histidine kinase n=1 Tax=Neobacillus niacini TaxID=86668 RepID=UPI0021CAF9AE|nr:sensor histidine kinase [Neobacillus niacini]MCM3766294.1 histidine kinase [Neobacillus niacini]
MWNKKQRMKAPRSFRFKVIFISIICLVIPATITLFIYNYLTKDTLKNQALANANRELTIANEYVEKLLRDMMYIVNFIQLDAEMNTILKGVDKSKPESDSDYKRYIDESKINRTIENITLVGEKAYVTIILKNGKSYTNYSYYEFDPSNLVTKDWFKQLNKLQGYESAWIASQPTMINSEQRNNPYQISVGRTLRDENLKIYGYVLVTIMENKVNQVFEKLHGSEEMMILDSSNHIISHQEDSKIGDLFQYSDQLVKINSSNIFQISNRNYLIAEHNISFVGWKLVSIIPYKQAVNQINEIFNKVFIVHVLSFTIFLLLMTYLLRTITKPMVYLGTIAEAVKRGNLSIRSRLRSYDEVGRLSESFNHMLDRVNEMIEEIKFTQERKRKAELAMLQAQINPHFLFNVLNSIRMKVLVKGDKDSAEMISSLSKLLRMTIDKNKEIVTFREEVQIISDYINIMNMRQKEKINVEIQVDEVSYSERFPRFILQPIIENSIIHGLNQGAGTIIVKSELAENQWVIKIEDNGLGMDMETLSLLRSRLNQSNGIEQGNHENNKGFSSLGLSNVYERMFITFGRSFQMDIQSSPGVGTKVILTIQKGGNADVQSNAS